MAPMDSHTTAAKMWFDLEISIVFLVLGVLRVGFTRAVLLQVVLGEGAGDGHVDRKSLAVLPVGDGHVARASAGLRSQDAFLLHRRGKHALAG